jgi:outer membrane protein assembly factor BamD
MKKQFLYAALLGALVLALPACTVFQWGGAAKEAPAPEKQADEVFREGEELLAKGKYEAARQKYSSVKEKDPEKYYDALVEVRLGDSYYEEARYAEAEVEYRRFLELHPKNKAAPYVVYQIGMCNFKQIDKPDRDPSFSINAMKRFNELLRDYPDNPYADEAREKLRIARNNVAEHEFVVGSYYYRTGSYKAAAARFKGIRDSYPGSKDEPETLYLLADSYLRLKDYDAAKNTLAVLYQEYPNNRFALKAKEKLAEKIPAK